MYKEKYFKELSKNYKNENQIRAEIINLSAILNLPKGTEHFISDIHGEYETFLHILKTASGVIKRKIEDEFGTNLSEDEKNELACIIYYPKEKLKICEKSVKWYKDTLYRLITICNIVSGKYTRSKVRKMLPKNFAYIIDELLNCDSKSINKEKYYTEIINSIITLNCADEFIIEISYLIQNLAIDHLHIVGDIFDRGKRPDIIIDYLLNYRSVDIQWGNHDIVWIGAGLGSIGCILTVLCDCFKYNNLELLEDGYSINLVPLYELVSKYYAIDSCDNFKCEYNSLECAKLYKAVSIMRFKVEDQLKMQYPDFEMQQQTVLDKIDFKTMQWNGYNLTDTKFPTIDKSFPQNLNEDEQLTIQKLAHSFTTSEKLKKHIKFLLKKGSMYLTYNGNLLYHGCVPLTKDGNLLEIEFDNKLYSGKNYMDYCDNRVRDAYLNPTHKNLSFIWQLWCGHKSPLFGKDKMASFERLFIDDNKTHYENKQYYFKLQENENICNNILKEFGLNEKTGHIVNGHIPVKYSNGESPVKANGKVFVIDGGMSKPYQKLTGIAGYTLIYNSYQLSFTQHKPFLGKKYFIENNYDDLSLKKIVENKEKRIRVKDTDKGKKLKQQIDDLSELLNCYKKL